MSRHSEELEDSPVPYPHTPHTPQTPTASRPNPNCNCGLCSSGLTVHTPVAQPAVTAALRAIPLTSLQTAKDWPAAEKVKKKTRDPPRVARSSVPSSRVPPTDRRLRVFQVLEQHVSTAASLVPLWERNAINPSFCGVDGLERLIGLMQVDLSSADCPPPRWLHKGLLDGQFTAFTCGTTVQTTTVSHHFHCEA